MTMLTITYAEVAQAWKLWREIAYTGTYRERMDAYGLAAALERAWKDQQMPTGSLVNPNDHS